MRAIAVEPVTTVEGVVTLDERTASAVAALAGLGTLHFSPEAAGLFRQYGFDSVGAVVAVIQAAGVSSAIKDGLRGRKVPS